MEIFIICTKKVNVNGGNGMLTKKSKHLVIIVVIRNISPSADRSCSSGLNGSDPEQKGERQRMKTFPGCRRHLKCFFDSEPVYLQIDETCKHIKATRKSSTYPC